MSTGTNEMLIMPTMTETAAKIGAKTKKSKKKNKVASSISTKAAADNSCVPVVAVAADDTTTMIEKVSSDLQERLKLTDAEDSGFGEANGHEESTLESAAAGNRAEPTSTVVRSGPDELSSDSRPVSQSDPAAKPDEPSSSETKPNESSITYVSYQNELQMPDIMRLIQKDLSEPYSIYTYRYFIHNWPKLCFLAMHGETCVGAIVCKLDIHRQNTKRGYIAMLAVDKEYRKLKIGTNLVQNAIQAMLAYNADEVVLETEITNIPALRLYENLGFVRDKRLFGYYLNGVDALRLKLWFR